MQQKDHTDSQTCVCLGQGFHITACMGTSIMQTTHADKIHSYDQRSFVSPTSCHCDRTMPLPLQPHMSSHHPTATTSLRSHHVRLPMSIPPQTFFYECTIATRCETHVHHAAPLQRWGKPPPHHHFRQEASLLDSLLVKRRAFLRVCSGHFLSHRPEVPQVVIPQVTVPPSATKEFHKVTEGLGCVGERLGALGER